MNVKNKALRFLCVCLAAILLICGLSSCAATSEVPDGYQYATCGGEYFRLFVPTQWTVNTESGISGAYSTFNISVTMTEVAFIPDETKEATPLEQYLEAHLAELAKMKDFKKEKTFDTTLSGLSRQGHHLYRHGRRAESSFPSGADPCGGTLLSLYLYRARRQF